MKKHKRHGLVVLFMMWLILFMFCPTVIAEAKEYSGDYNKGISLSTTVPPSITSGSGAEYHRGSTEGLTFTTDDAVKAFQRVLIDEAELPSESYTVSGEPLTVTLHTDYLDTLCAGEHKIKIVTANGEASADFSVISNAHQENVEVRNDSPNTGDSGNTAMWTMMLIMCSGSLAIAFLTRPKRRKENKK